MLQQPTGGMAPTESAALGTGGTLDVTTLLVVAVLAYAYALAFLSTEPHPVRLSRHGEPFFVVLIPTLNEANVIARTLASVLRLSGRFMVLVIDDDSDDDTAAVVASFLGDPRLRLLRRSGAQARLGKGEVLNAAFAEISAMGLARGQRPVRKPRTMSARRRRRQVRYRVGDDIVVTVFDADGLVEPGFFQAVAPLFQDPRVAGVQSAVRMYNAGHNVLTFWQHFEFVAWGELFSRAKHHLGSATLGGNGQCVRYSALAGLGSRPWRASLTEDLDLSLRLLIAGWRIEFCPSVAVYQEALSDPRQLVQQRSRWLQGHVVAWQYLPRLLRAALPLRSRLDLTAFLLLPALIFPIGLASIGSGIRFLLDFGTWDLADLVRWYALGFGAVPLVTYAWRRTGDAGLIDAVRHAHLYGLYSIVWFLASLVAFWKIMRGQRAWLKTSRLALERSI